MAIDILKGASGTPLVFLMVQSSDHITALTGASPTVKIGKNGGTGAAPSGAITEVDSTNLPGLYKVAGNATDTNTAGPLWLHATAASGDPTDILVANIIDPAVAVYGANAVNLGGTAQTGRDIGASVLLSAGTGTGQLDFTSGVVKANLAQILGTALTETSGQIAAAFKKFFNIATPASTMDALTLVATATNLTNAPTAGDFTATMKTSIGTAVAASAVASVTASVTVGTNNDKTGYALTSGERTSIADALLNRDMSSVTDTTARSPLNALRFLRNKFSISGGTLTVTKEDDTTSAWTSTLTTDAAAVPITGSDPA